MQSRLVDPHHLEVVEDARQRRSASGAPFDRAEFARRVLDLLQPDNWTIALYLRDGDFHIERVRDLRRGPDAVWATVGICASSSRAEIALRLAELTGLGGAPFLVDLLAAERAAGPQLPPMSSRA